MNLNVLDGRILRLPSPRNYSSWGFTGRQNWTVFRNTDLTGHSECLVADVDNDGDFGVTFNINRTLTVGSIWRGCGSLDPKVLGRRALFQESSGIMLENQAIMAVIMAISIISGILN